MDLRVSRSEAVGLHMEQMGLQESVMGLETAEFKSIAVAMVVTGLGRGMKGQGLWIIVVSGGETGPMTVPCWSSR